MINKHISTNLPTPVMGGVLYLNATASSLVRSGVGTIAGIFVASASASPTIKLWDSLAGSGAVLVNTFTPIAGTWHPIPFNFANGLYITIGGTVDCTVSYT